MKYNFNEEIKTDYTDMNVREHVYRVLHVVDTGIGYYEVKMEMSRRAENVISDITHCGYTDMAHRKLYQQMMYSIGSPS